MSADNIGASTHHSGYFCLCGLFLSGIFGPVNVWLSKNRPKAYRFGTSALLFALHYLHILFFRPILNII